MPPISARVRSNPTAVFIWPWRPDGAALSTVDDVLAKTPPETDVIVPMFTNGGERARAPVDTEGLRLMELEIHDGAGFAVAANRAAQLSSDADLVVVADATVLPMSWLRSLRLAAMADDTVAAATTLARGGTDRRFPGFTSDRGATASIRRERDRRASAGSPLHPRVFSLWPHCTFIKRSALQLLGPFSDSLAHPAAVLADFACKAQDRGLSCVLADDVCVDLPVDGLPPCPDEDHRALAARYPWRWASQEEEAAAGPGPLRRSLVAARASRGLISVTIDARALGPTKGGTQTYIAGLALALARSERVSLRAVVAADAPPDVLRAFAGAGIEVASYDDAAASRLHRTDIAHRPQQAFTSHDLRLLQLMGERVVISQLDLISYRAPSYHASPEKWLAYRRDARLVLGAADRVVFFSEHARDDAIAEDLIEPERTAIAGIGIDHRREHDETRRPGRLRSEQELLLVLGSDYQHKNRLFALELFDQLRLRHGWDGLLVLAGPHVTHGSSSWAEAELLASRPHLGGSIVDLGPVSEPEKRWLLEHAQALLCPSICEGFGLTPLEAAAAWCPCIYPATTSLAEIVGHAAATIVPWDAAASADTAIGLLAHGPERQRHLELLRAALERHRWEPVVDRLYRVYVDAIASPYRASATRAWDEYERDQKIVGLDASYRNLQERVAHGLPLIDRGGLLTHAEQRGLMRVASRGWLRRPMLGPFALIGTSHLDSLAKRTATDESQQ